MDRRLLTPAEATLLLEPATGTATKCIQAGLLNLLGAERIAFETTSNPFKQSALIIKRDSPTTSLLPQHLVALEETLRAFGKDRLVSSEVLSALQKRFGYSYSGYLKDEVAPGLVKRGLLTRDESKWLGLFPRTLYQRTPRGEALIAPIQRLMLAIEKLPSLLASDPDKAIQLARSAGVLLVMSPKARRQIPKLRKLLDEHGYDPAALSYLAIESDSGKLEQGLDLGDMALALDFDLMLDGLEAVGDFTSGADGNSSDGGDGGGGGD